MRKSVLILAFVFILAPIKAQNVYIGQNAVGAANGADCADAYPASFFNSAAHWPNPIGPGTTVHLCGTISGAGTNTTILAAQGSGTSGSPITIFFETGANITSPQMAVGIQIGTNSNFIIDGGVTCGYVNGPGSADVPCNGTIQNTAAGSAFTNEGQSSCIQETGGSIEVRNLNCVNMYVRTVSTDTNPPGCVPYPTFVYFAGAAPGLNVHNNIVHDVCWALNGDADNITLAHNDFYHFAHGVGAGSNSIEHVGFVSHDNHYHDPSNWNSPANSYHLDGIHLYWPSVGHIAWNGSLIYNDVFDGFWGTNVTAMAAVWANVNAVVFNNVFNNSANTGGLANGMLSYSGDYSGGNTTLNNTFIGCGVSCETGGNPLSLGQGPHGVNGQTVRNNFVGFAGVLATAANSGVTAPFNFTTNIYGPSETATPFFAITFSTFATWAGIYGESGSRWSATLNPMLNANGLPATGSPLIGAGTNLSSLCIMNGGTLPNALCSDILGHPRPEVGGGAWDAGAYSSGTTSGDQPPAPSGLIATVNN